VSELDEVVAEPEADEIFPKVADVETTTEEDVIEAAVVSSVDSVVETGCTATTGTKFGFEVVVGVVGCVVETDDTKPGFAAGPTLCPP
jgi:hypothetical protein